MDKLATEASLPTGFSFSVVDNSLLIYFLQVRHAIPKVAGCISLKSDKTLVCAVEDKTVPVSQYSDLVTNQVMRLSQIINLMARLKSWITESSSTSFALYAQTAVALLLSAADRLPDSDSSEYRQVSFIIEQLELLQRNKHGGITLRS